MAAPTPLNGKALARRRRSVFKRGDWASHIFSELVPSRRAVAWRRRLGGGDAIRKSSLGSRALSAQQFHDIKNFALEVMMEVLGFDWSKANVLVTGLPGFKASWLAGALHDLGAKVSAISRNKSDPESAYSYLDLGRHVAQHYVDVSNFREVLEVINKVRPNVIFHLAATALVPVALRSPLRTFEVNILGTANIVEACRQLRCSERLLVCSTDHVFGHQSALSPDEEYDGIPPGQNVGFAGPYDTSKAAMELVVRSYHANYYMEVPAIGITRSANVFGPADTNQRRIVPLFIDQVRRGEPIKLRFRKNGRQFIHIADVTAGYIRAASALHKNSETAARLQKAGLSGANNVSTPTYHFALERYSGRRYLEVEALADLIARLGHGTVDKTECIDFAPNEIEYMALNCSSTKERLNWEPRMRLEEGLTQVLDWYDRTRTRSDRSRIVGETIDSIRRSLKDEAAQ